MTLRIRNWSSNFENNKSRILDCPHWVPMPNRHDGMRLKKLMLNKNGLAAFGLFVLLVEKVSRQPKRHRDGWLTQDGSPNGEPISTADMALLFDRSEKEIILCIDTLKSRQVEWLQECGTSVPDGGTQVPDEGQQKERKEREGKEGTKRGTKVPLVFPSSPILDNPEFQAAWLDWNAERKARGKPLTERAAKLQLDKLESFGLAGAIRSIKQSIENGWQGLFEPKGDFDTEPEPTQPNFTPEQIERLKNAPDPLTHYDRLHEKLGIKIGK